MIVLDGKKIAKLQRAKLKEQIDLHLQKGQRPPKLVVLLVGHNAASETYVLHKKKAAAEVGIITETLRFAKEIAPQKLYQEIQKLNQDPTVDGILLQLPMPETFVEEDYLQAIVPHKDVDGFHYIHQGRLLQGYQTIAPCTPLGVVRLLESYAIPIAGQIITIIGTSKIVGKPLGMMLLELGATIIFCNKYTKNLKEMCQKADILISGTGQQFIVRADMVKSGAVVIDIGIIRDPKTQRLVGDVDYQAVAPKTTYITPVPGGVGPMTVAMLLENTYKLYLEHLAV